MILIMGQFLFRVQQDPRVRLKKCKDCYSRKLEAQLEQNATRAVWSGMNKIIGLKVTRGDNQWRLGWPNELNGLVRSPVLPLLLYTLVLTHPHWFFSSALLSTLWIRLPTAGKHPQLYEVTLRERMPAHASVQELKSFSGTWITSTYVFQTGCYSCFHQLTLEVTRPAETIWYCWNLTVWGGPEDIWVAEPSLWNERPTQRKTRLNSKWLFHQEEKQDEV